MKFQRLREFGNWFFAFHEGKGARYVGGAELRRCIGITGACMMMPRSLALQVGGFDAAYLSVTSRTRTYASSWRCSATAPQWTQVFACIIWNVNLRPAPPRRGGLTSPYTMHGSISVAGMVSSRPIKRLRTSRRAWFRSGRHA